MLINPLNRVTRHIRRSVLNSDQAGFTDGQLLSIYIDQQEEAAFAALVRRHGPMVWDVCRRVIGNNHDAEDAFQATFLVLVRKADEVVPRSMVGNWLYGVAYRTALKARAMAARRKAREKQVQQLPETAVNSPESGHDLRRLLDQELSRLPHLYRVPIVLCDLEGKTRNEAAAQLGCPAGTLAARHARARTMLAKRLARHGLTVSGATFALAFQANAASAGLPGSLVAATVAAASEFAEGKLLTGLLVSPEVAALTSSLLKSTLAAKLKIALSVLLAVAVIGGSVAVAMYPSAPPPAETAQEPTESVRNDAKKLNAPDALGLIRTIEHGGELWFVVFSPDGKYLLTGGDDQTACLYETSTGQVITGPLAHTDTITAGAISSDNRTLITVAMDGTARIWDAGTGRPRGKVMRHRSKVNAVALSPDGTLVATASADGSAQLWVASTGAPLDIVLQHGAAITDVAFLPDGRTLLTSGWDGIVRQWNVAKGESVRRLLTEQRGVTAMSVSFDGRVLLTGSRDRGGQLWDIATGIPISAAFSVDRYFANIAFSPDSRTFLTGDFAKRGDGTALPGTVRLWETASVQPIGPAFVGEDGLAFHPNGRICATTGNSKVHLWDLRTRLAGIRGETADSVLSLWSELAGKDATRAFQAMDVLTTEPEKSVPFLEKQLLAAAVAEEESGRGPNAVPKGRGQVGPGRIGPEQLRLMRSVQVLEAIGSSSARDVLRKLGQGSPELALTRDARASLARLDSKP